jgi:hypothetical protein
MTERTPQDLFSQPPEADAWEQLRAVDDDELTDAPRPRTPIEADPADAYEQQQPVPSYDDDYR